MRFPICHRAGAAVVERSRINVTALTFVSGHGDRISYLSQPLEDPMSRFGRQVSLFVMAAAISFPAFTQEAGVVSYRVEVVPWLLSGGEPASARISVRRDTSVPPQTLTFRLSSDNNTLIRVPEELVTIPSNQESVTVKFATSATPIRATTSLRAYLGPGYRTSVAAQIEVVPALLKSVTLSSASMIGTIGNTINVTAELKAPAPAGGIELYLSPFKLLASVTGVKASSYTTSATHRVQAGSRSVTFPIRYNDVIETFSDLQMNSHDFAPVLETQTRRYEQIVALDPPPNKVWLPIPSRAIAAVFDVIPLKVNSITVQPTSLPDTGEALATFVLNSSPVSTSERVYPDTSGGGSRAVLIGSSCAATSNLSPPPEIQLTPGVTSYQFKICGRPVTSATTNQVHVNMRSGLTSTNVTVLP